MSQNIADIDEIPASTHLRLVTQPAAERAIYLELMYLFIATGFLMKKNKRGGDMDKRIRELLGKCEDAYEALLIRAAHFETDGQVMAGSENATKACDSVVTIRQAQYKQLKCAFMKELRKAEWLERSPEGECLSYSNWKSRVKENTFGDAESASDIFKNIQNAQNSHSANDWREFYYRDEDREGFTQAQLKAADPTLRRMPRGMTGGNGINIWMVDAALRDVTKLLSKWQSELCSRNRSLRFFRHVRDLQSLYTRLSKGEELRDSFKCSKCNTAVLDIDTVSILSACGHAICEPCLHQFTADLLATCPVEGCKAPIAGHQIINAPELGIEDERTHVGLHYGKKLESVVDLIKSIQEDDQVLLFVQFQSLLEKVELVLDKRDINFVSLRGSKDAAKALMEFQTTTGSKKKKVLVLNIGDASAAGR
jgi:hypothetical protein